MFEWMSVDSRIASSARAPSAIGFDDVRFGDVAAHAARTIDSATMHGHPRRAFEEDGNKIADITGAFDRAEALKWPR
jgi:hypothetical protein